MDSSNESRENRARSIERLKVDDYLNLSHKVTKGNI